MGEEGATSLRLGLVTTKNSLTSKIKGIIKEVVRNNIIVLIVGFKIN